MKLPPPNPISHRVQEIEYLLHKIISKMQEIVELTSDVQKLCWETRDQQFDITEEQAREILHRYKQAYDPDKHNFSDNYPEAQEK